MNWMTSGKHRALYSQRGRRRQMHFPSQIQCQRVQSTSPPRHRAHSVRDLTTPWYIVPVGDDNESQDIRVLELERKGARSGSDLVVQDMAPTRNGGARSSLRQTQSRDKRGQESQHESRCIFTPVKKARKYEQRLLPTTRGEGPPSIAIASGVDMPVFDDSEELLHKTRAQCAKQAATADPAPTESRKSSFSQQFHGNGDRDRLRGVQQQLQQSGLDLDFDKEAYASEGCEEKQRFFDDQQTLFNDTSETDEREFQRRKINSNYYADFDSGLPFDRPDNASFRNTSEPSRGELQCTSPPSPVDVSPLSFRMSRAEVLQSQLSTKFHDGTRDPAEHRMSYTPIMRPSPSPSPSTSSQSSIVLDRPPLGWQNKLMLSLRENTIDELENHFDSPASRSGETSSPSPTHVVDGNRRNHGPQRFALGSSPSPRSSTGSDGENSLLNAVVPANAKEQIMAAATSQQLAPDSRMWFQRPADMMKPDVTNRTDAAFSGKSMAFQQSWVMSSRTKTILDVVSTLKDPIVKSATEGPKTEHQEMESVAVYMYTLVQCYKIDESLRADGQNVPVAKRAQLVYKASSPPAAIALTNQSACRREIIFSAKHVAD